MSRRDYGRSSFDYNRGYEEGPGGQGQFDDLPPPPYDGEGEGPGAGMEPGGGLSAPLDQGYAPGAGGPGSYSPHGRAPMSLDPGIPSPGGSPMYDPFLPQVNVAPGSSPSASSLDPSQHRGASPFAPPRPRDDDDPMPSSDHSDLLIFPRAASSRNYNNGSSSRQPMIIQPQESYESHSLQQSESSHLAAPMVGSGHRRSDTGGSSSSRSYSDRDRHRQGHRDRDRMSGGSGSFDDYGPGGSGGGSIGNAPPGFPAPMKPQRSDMRDHSPSGSFDASYERHPEDEIKIAPPAVVPAVVSEDVMRDSGSDGSWRNRDERHHSSASGGDMQRPAVVLSVFGGGDADMDVGGDGGGGGGGGALVGPDDANGDDLGGGGVHSDRDVLQAFKKVDRAKCGKVGAKDLAAFMKRHKIAATPDEIEGLVTFAAANMKHITENDFQRAYRAAIQQDALQNMAF